MNVAIKCMQWLLRAALVLYRIKKKIKKESGEIAAGHHLHLSLLQQRHIILGS